MVVAQPSPACIEVGIVPAIVAIISGIPGIVERVAIPWVIPRPTPIVGRISITIAVAVEPRVVVAVPSAHAAAVGKVVVDSVAAVFGHKGSVYIHRVGIDTIALLKLDDVVAQTVIAQLLIVAPVFATTVIFIHITVAAHIVCGLCVGRSLRLLLRGEIEVILCHRRER